MKVIRTTLFITLLVVISFAFNIPSVNAYVCSQFDSINWNLSGQNNLTIDGTSGNCSGSVQINVVSLPSSTAQDPNGTFTFTLQKNSPLTDLGSVATLTTIDNQSTSFTYPGGNWEDGSYQVRIAADGGGSCVPLVKAITVQNCQTPTATPPACVAQGQQCDPQNQQGNCCNTATDVCVPSSGGVYRCEDGNAIPTPTPLANNPASPATADPQPYNPCEGIQDPTSRQECIDCLNPGDTLGGGTYTALGCIPNNPADFAGQAIANIFGMAGGLAFLLLLYGSFLCITSQGNPEKTQACKQTITAAIVGLVLVILSLFIFNILFRNTGILPNIIPMTFFT